MFIVMKITDDPLRNSRGIVLMSALTILSVLLAARYRHPCDAEKRLSSSSQSSRRNRSFLLFGCRDRMEQKRGRQHGCFSSRSGKPNEVLRGRRFRCFIPTPRFGRTADSASRGPFCRHHRSVFSCARSSIDENLRSCRRRVGAPRRRRAYEYQRQRPVYFRNGPRSGKRQSSDRGEITERDLSI